MNSQLRLTRKSLTILALSTLLACGGGGGGSTGGGTPVTPPVNAFATSLSYINPTSGTYRLIKNLANSTPTHLVFDLVGPSGKVSGVGFFLTVDSAKATWVPVGSGDAEKIRSSVFANTILQSKVSGETLQAGIYQKGTTAPVIALETTVLASVALELKSQVPLSNPANVVLTSGKALILNDPADPSVTSAITITLGTLSAN